MKNLGLKISLIALNLSYSIFISYRVDQTFRRTEKFPEAMVAEKFLFLILLILILFNFIFEKRILKNKKYQISFTLLILDFIMISPILYFTINELLW